MSIPPSAESPAELLQVAEDLKFEAKHEEALLVLERLLLENPANIDALEEVADNELSLGFFDRAAKAAEQVIELDKDSCNAHYILGFVASHEEKWEESVKELKEANRLEPNDPEILRCLGWSLFSSGAQASGIVTLERALNLEPDNPLILCDLGVVYLRSKNYPKSISLLRRAIEVDPRNDRAKECLEMAHRIAERGTIEV